MFFLTGNEKASQLLSHWGLSLDTLPLKINGRVLEAEKITLSRSCFTTNQNCDWTRNLGNDILVAVDVKTWILVYVERDAGKAQDFTKTLVEVGSKMGMKIGAPKMVGLPNDRTDTYVNRIRDEINPSVTLNLIDRNLFP